MCTGEWRGMGVARSPSHESVTTDLSLFSVSSAASDARVLRLLACKAGQGPEPSLRVASPNPEGKALSLRRGSPAVPLQSDACRDLLAGCASLCAQLGLRRSFSAGDVFAPGALPPVRSATSEVGLCAALEALTLNAASRSCSTWVAGEYYEKVQERTSVLLSQINDGNTDTHDQCYPKKECLELISRLTVGGSQLPSPQRSQPVQLPQRTLPTDNKKVRQSYIKRRLITTYRALERMSQSEFNLDKLGAAAVSAVSAVNPGPITITVPTKNTSYVHPEAAHLALTAADLERERGRALSKYERNMMIFNWLHTLDEASPF